MNELVNRGLMRLNDHEISEQATVVVLGLPRSGTSFLSSTVANLGIFLGEKAFPPTYEDKLLKDAFDDGDLHRLDEIVRRYDSIHDLWGIKLPRSSHRPELLVERLRLPRLLVAFRDPLAVHLRMQLSQGAPNALSGLGRLYSQYSKLIGYLKLLDIPMLLVSYDKTLSNRESAIREIANFCGISNEQVIQAAVGATRKDSQRYLDEVRVNKTYGVVEEFAKNVVKGWAIHQDVKGKSRPEIECRVDGLPVDFECRIVSRHDLKHRSRETFEALGIRKEFVGRNLRSFDGQIGFEIEFREPVMGCLCLKVIGDSVPFFERPISG